MKKVIFYVNSHYKNFQLILLRNGWVILVEEFNPIDFINPVENWGQTKNSVLYFSSFSWRMADLIYCSASWSTAVLHGILQCWGLCLVSRLDYLQLKSNYTKFQLNPIRKGIVMVWLRFCSAAWKTAVLQGLSFVSRLDYLQLKSNYAKYQLNLLRNGLACAVAIDIRNILSW